MRFLLPFTGTPARIGYAVVDGYAVTEGDILLGKVDGQGKLIIDPTTEDEPPLDPRSDVRTVRQELIAVTGWQRRWQDGVIPFEIGNGYSNAMLNRIQAAVAAVNRATNLTLRARTGETDFVRFTPTPAGAQATCSSFVGRSGGMQPITLTDRACAVGSIQHEILHAAGAWHEHTRNDRNGFVTYNPGNVNTNPTDPSFNFDRHVADGVDIGAYDYGSIMHYPATAFAVAGRQTLTSVMAGNTYDLDGRACVSPGVASPTNQQVMGQRNCLSALDIAGINALYPFLTSNAGGERWGSSFYATDIAFGDIDGDGRDEVAIARRADDNDRVYLLDDAASNYRPLANFGGDWGSSYYATGVAFGDVNGDGRDELGIVRRSDNNHRIFLVDRVGANTFNTTTPGNSNRWGSSSYATDIAFGNVDGDAREEMLITRKSSGNARWYLFDDARARFGQLASGGNNWGGSYYATSAAFGDIDGDGRDEFAIGRRASENGRYYVFRYDGQSRLLRTGASDWGSSNYTTDLAFGDIDGDGRDELGVVRKASSNSRYFIYDDLRNGFRTLLTGGKEWGSGNFATSIAFGDVDNDGRDEIAVGRKTDTNARYWVLDDADGLFLTISSGGQPWGSSNYATGVAFGDVNGDNRADLGLARRSNVNMRYAIFPSGR